MLFFSINLYYTSRSTLIYAKGIQMAFLQTWLDSLKFFIPKNFKLFFLVTLKSIIETYKILLFKFWPVLVFLFLIRFILQGFFINPLIGIVFAFLFHAFFLFLCFLIIRPSVKLKNYYYIKDYWFYFIFFFVIFFVHQQLFINFYTIGFWLMLIPFFISPPCIFLTLFYLDGSALSLKPFWQSLKMVWYNLPFCLVSYGFFMILGRLLFIQWPLFFNFFYILTLSESLPLLQEMIAWPFYLLFIPIPLCWFANFYTKQVHAQFQLYMPNNKKGL